MADKHKTHTILCIYCGQEWPWKNQVHLLLPPFQLHNAAVIQSPTRPMNIWKKQLCLDPETSLSENKNNKTYNLKDEAYILRQKITSVILEEWQNAQTLPFAYNSSQVAREEMTEVSSLNLHSALKLETAA